MNLRKLYVIDTSAFISYFNNVFGESSQISRRARDIVSDALFTISGSVRLSIPSIVFVEIFEKWLRNEEFNAKFYYEIYKIILESPNIEIKPIELEVLENLLIIGGNLRNHDLHDKIILASAMMLECPLI